ncbi:ATP-binding protein [Streptomyces anulatus]|uniref:ATP-binding protein n=1 Tax=Streptomyces anulatus TaxID=1892 RepID=UPI00365994D0
MEPTMTTHLADQEHARRRAPDTADSPRTCAETTQAEQLPPGGVRGAAQPGSNAPAARCPHAVRVGFEMSIGRRPGPRPEGLTAVEAAWPGRLRRIARAGLEKWAPHLTDTALLLLSELVTNAFQHGHGSAVGIRLYLGTRHFVIEVRGGSSTGPISREPDPDAEHGRGLILVDSLADAWGVSEDGDTTWCAIAMFPSLRTTTLRAAHHAEEAA